MQNSYNSEDPVFTSILYRSLYILKKKFEIYKNEINKLYILYFVKDKNNYNNIRNKIIKLSSFKQLLEEVFNLTNISIFKMSSLNELFVLNCIPETNRKERLNKAIEKINNFISDKIQKYNEIYYNKKLKSEKELNSLEEISNDLTEFFPTVEYDKKGKIINLFEEVKKKNRNNAEIYKSNEMIIQEEYELNIKEANILYIETLPIIIADFIQLNPKYVIINNDNDDNDLNKEIKDLFDGEIMKKIEKDNEDLTEKISDLPQKFEDEMKIRNLLKQQNEINKKIKTYEILLHDNKKSGKNITFLQEFIDKLKEEKEKFFEKINNDEKGLFKKYKSKENIINENNNNNNETQNIKNMNVKMKVNKSHVKILDNNNIPTNKKIITKKNELDDNLYEIFYFYANHQNNKLNSPTFDEMAYKKERLNFEELSKFLIDFDVKIQKEILLELFNKNSTKKLMTFEQFKQIFWKIGLPMNDFKKDKLLLKVKTLNERIKQIKSEDPSMIDKNFYYNKNIIQEPNNIKIEKTENQIKNIEKEYKRLDNFNYDQVQEEFDNYVAITEPKVYREKMKGFYNLKERICQINLFEKFQKPKLMKIPSNFILKRRKETNKKSTTNLYKNDNKENNKIINESIKKKNNEEYENETIKETEKINEQISDKSKQNPVIKKDNGEVYNKYIKMFGHSYKKGDENENKNKEEEEKIETPKANIFSYEKIQKSSLKDLEVDENDEKLLLIDSEDNNSDEEILNRFGNGNDKKKNIINEEIKENLGFVKKDNEKDLNIEEKDLNKKEKNLNKEEKDLNKEEKDLKKEIKIENNIKNQKKNSFISSNKGRIKSGNYKNSINKINSTINDNKTNNESSNNNIIKISRNIKNEKTAYQKYNRSKSLINAGNSIINSNMNSNELHTSFLNSNIDKNSNNIESSYHINKSNKTNKLINPKIMKILK